MTIRILKQATAFLSALLILTVSSSAAFQKTNTYSGNFKDVSPTSWYADDVKTAYELGFMNGKSSAIFDPDGSVTIIEGITMASRLHALYNGTSVTGQKVKIEDVRFDFDDPSIIVDLSQRNSRNNDGISFNHADGEIKNGVLIVTPTDTNASGNYDPGVCIEGLELNAKQYRKLTFRMKRDYRDNLNPSAARNETVEIYFKTSISPSYTANKCVRGSMKHIADLTEWFEIEVELGQHERWTDYITGIRFDPTNNNGIYYIDSIVLSASDKNVDEEWYDIYVDYAVQNGIIEKRQYSTNDYGRSITRLELCCLFASAVPEENFPPINTVRGIPDIDRDRENADVLLMLYNAGILLGADGEGNFKADLSVKRSECAAIINRIALPENRVKGTIAADWTSQSSSLDIEFDKSTYPGSITYDAESVEIKNGTLVLKSKDRGESQKSRFDPKITISNININAEEYTKLKVRMKADFGDKLINKNIDFYFMSDTDTNFSESKSLHQDLSEYCYTDAAGWYVLEIDFRLHPHWKDTIKSVRFDPTNSDGTFTIDYIRFLKDDLLHGASHEELLQNGYTATRILDDEGFENGFYVAQFEQKENHTHGSFTDYCETDAPPMWKIAPWWSKYDLYDNRDLTTDKYTIADTYGVNSITYNPVEKSLKMRMNATKIYNGEPHIAEEYKWWPHLLVEQGKDIRAFDKEKNSAAGDRMFVELDIRLLDFKDTTNPEGVNNCSFLAYFYLNTDKAPGQLIWFGLRLFNGLNANTNVTPGWSPDSAAHQYMYGIPQAVIYDGIENSFNPQKGVAAVSDEWKHIRLDVTPHIERAVEWANRDNIFGVKVTKEDMYFSGVNIGYEIHGNYDCTFEIKNFNMVSYNLDGQ